MFENGHFVALFRTHAHGDTITGSVDAALVPLPISHLGFCSMRTLQAAGY
jgi:hypothetical protein